ncbi:MAG: Uncharacterized protein Greene041662_870 [Candidatus Peregrinibacteria bacterium Greene0416_62]|nr:MAG: Uncharacterized protein Greene041662_870 [Candidatus Peregrinibacteria bacterium Greene0416_62]
MKHTSTSTAPRNPSTPLRAGGYAYTAKRAASLAAILGLLLADTPIAIAASSWNPGLLVNTESFQTIDEGDSATDVELRFGGTLNEKIFWDYETSRFEFTDDVHVTGNLTATGTIIADGAISTKANLTLNSDNGDADATLTFGNDGGAETIKFNNTSNDFEVSDDFETQGTSSGRILHAQDELRSSGAIFATGNIKTRADLTINSDNGNAAAVLTFGNDADTASLTFSNDADPTFTLDDTLNVTGNVDATGTLSGDGNFTINEDQTAADAILTFGSDGTNETLTFANTADRFEFSDDVYVTGDFTVKGTASGKTVYATESLRSSGSLVWEGSASGASLWVSSFKGAGLVDTCDPTTGKLTWNSTSQRFVCGTDSGTTYAAGQGLTLTSAVFSLSPSFSGTALEILGTASGRVVHAQDEMRSSGTLVVHSTIKTRSDLTINSDNGAADAILTFGNDAAAETIRFNDTTNNFALSDDIDVTGNVDATGTISGDGNFTINEDQTAADAVLTFGSDGTNETLTFANSADRFEFTDDVHISSTLEVDGNAQFDGGTLTIGDASGDAVTVNSNAWTFANDTNFVLSGDVNGLSFDTTTFSVDGSNNRIGIGTAAPDTTLEVIGTASGRDIYARDSLRSSGSLVWEGAASGASLWVSTFKGAGLVSTCDSTTGKLTWDSTTQRFACSTDLNTGTTYSAGQGLTLTSTVFSLSPSFSGTALEILGTASGRVVHAQDEMRSSGTLVVHSTIKTRSDLTINSDQTADTNAVLTFGSDDVNETLTFADSADRFEFSDDVRTTGYLSGSTLTVDGTITVRGRALVFPNTVGASGSILRTDGAGNLSWTTGSEGSGDILSLHPEYPNAIYYQSGSTFIGQLAGSGGLNSGFENTYQWTSSKSTIQDYWISTKIRVPDNFQRWDPVKALQLRYRTKSATTTVNHITVKLLDTAGAAVALTGGATLANTSFTTASISGPSAAGTYTPGGFITVLIKLASTSSGQANAGFLTVNWETKNP